MSEQPGTHGYLALVQLLASAAVDNRLASAPRNALAALARYAGPDGTCCVSTARLAELLGVSRQAVQKSLRIAASSGYLAGERRFRATGAEGAKVWTFNLGLQGAVACPVPWPQGVQPPEVAGGCNRQRLQGVQPPEVAHKKPLQETNSEKTNASSPRGSSGNGPSRGKTAGLQAKRPAQQPSMLLPIPGGVMVRARVADHNRDRRAEASGRLWAQWSHLDPDLDLIEHIGVGQDDVQERAIDREIQKRGRGCAYIAGAIERATGGEITARDILGGGYRRSAS